MLTNRSEFPGTPMMAFDTKSESPITAMRVCGLAGVLPAGATPAAAAGTSLASSLTVKPIVMGPLRSPDFSSKLTLPPASSDFTSDSDQLRSLVCRRFWTVSLGFALACPLTDWARGYAVIIVKSFVMGCDGYGGATTGTEESVPSILPRAPTPR